MEIIIVNKISVEVEWKNIKNIHLTVYPPNARVHVSAPLSMPKDSIRLYIITKLEWINKNIEMILNQSRQTEREYVSGENHYYRGIRYRLNVVYQKSSPKVMLNGTQFINLYIREGVTTEKRAEVMREWYRIELKKLIPDIIKKWEKSLNVKVNDWQVMQMRTNWGTCNIEKKRIMINLELAKKPPHCLEYVILHEIVHLLERHHNERFIKYMDAFLPNWKQIRTELNQLPVSHADWEY
ncbi:MAG: SprT family zinc-dependent metalloprotease [Bacteroidales bacterium]